MNVRQLKKKSWWESRWPWKQSHFSEVDGVIDGVINGIIDGVIDDVIDGVIDGVINIKYEKLI